MGKIRQSIKRRVDSIAVVTETSTSQRNILSECDGGFEFRPLTEEEKIEFVLSLNSKGEQLLAELAGESKALDASAEDEVPFCPL